MRAAALFLLAAAPALAFGMTAPELQKRMESAETGIRTLRFNYRQELRSTLTDEVQVASGTASLMKPRHLRIDQSSPEPRLVVSEGGSVYVYTPRFKQVLKDSWERWMDQNGFFPGLVGFADGFEKLKREYVWSEPVREREDGGESVVVSLRRPAPEADTELKIWMSDVDYLPRKAVLLSGTLQVTTVLTELQKNPEFKRGLFSFQRPPDAEMIEMP